MALSDPSRDISEFVFFFSIVGFYSCLVCTGQTTFKPRTYNNRGQYGPQLESVHKTKRSYCQKVQHVHTKEGL